MRLHLIYCVAISLSFFCTAVQSQGLTETYAIQPVASGIASAPFTLQPERKPYNPLGPSITWSTGPSGWVRRDGNRFLAIGIWNIPGHNEAAGNATAFEDAASLFNVIRLRYGKDHSYMDPYLTSTSEATLLIGGHFKDRLKHRNGGGLWNSKIRDIFINGTSTPWEIDYDQDGALSYDNMRQWRLNIEEGVLKQAYIDYIRDDIVWDHVVNYGIDNTFIWLVGEESNSHFGTGVDNTNEINWYIHPDLLKLYTDEIEAATTNALTFVDLFGDLKGDVYNWERHGWGTRTPDVEDLPDPLPHVAPEVNNEIIPTWGAFTAADTTDYTTFRFIARDDNQANQFYKYGTPPGSPSGTPPRWLDRHHTKMVYSFYNTVKTTAAAYKETGMVLGLNAYKDFGQHPHMAGWVVDAIKEGTSQSRPVWLFFDADPNKRIVEGDVVPLIDTTMVSYFKNVKTQVYTAIAHGATGILFFSNTHITNADSTNQYNPTYWDSVKSLASDLRTQSDRIKGTVMHQGFTFHPNIGARDSTLHYSIRRLTDGTQTLILANTDTVLTRNSTFPDTLGFAAVDLKGLSTYVSPPYWSGPLAGNTTWSDTVYVNGDVIVPVGDTLTVAANTVVYFSGLTDRASTGVDHLQSARVYTSGARHG